jgi:hypothetical protein
MKQTVTDMLKKIGANGLLERCCQQACTLCIPWLDLISLHTHPQAEKLPQDYAAIDSSSKFTINKLTLSAYVYTYQFLFLCELNCTTKYICM